jgi:hypothetical protein
MSKINYKPIEPLSGWLEYKLLTDKLDPPVFRCRLRPVDAFSMMDGIPADGKFKMGRATVEVVIEAVAEWDLEEGGKPIPCTSEMKAGYLRPIIAEAVEGCDTLLGIAIVHDAQRPETFLKNS